MVGPAVLVDEVVREDLVPDRVGRAPSVVPVGAVPSDSVHVVGDATCVVLFVPRGPARPHVALPVVLVGLSVEYLLPEAREVLEVAGLVVELRLFVASLEVMRPSPMSISMALAFSKQFRSDIGTRYPKWSL